MKKAFTFVMAIAMTLGLTASAAKTKVVFNRPQFQPHEFDCSLANKKIDGLYLARAFLTVPLVYKGTVSQVTELLGNNGSETWRICDSIDAAAAGCPKAYEQDPDDANKNKTTETHCCYLINSTKETLPIYMTICQPCIDCFPCVALDGEISDVPVPFEGAGTPGPDGDENELKIDCAAQPGPITKWNLYYVFEDKKEKETYIEKYNLLDPAYNATFFTGKKGSNPAFMYIGGYHDLFLTGKKSDYSFKYYEAFLDEYFDWTAPASKASTGYVKSLASMSGTTTISSVNPALRAPCEFVWKIDDDDPAEVPASKRITATFKLTRDASLTKKAINLVFGKEESEAKDHWETCASGAAYCEEYFTESYGDLFDNYLDATYDKSQKNSKWYYEADSYGPGYDDLFEKEDSDSYSGAE